MKELSQERVAGICRSFSLLLHAGIPLADGAYLLSREETDPAAALLETMGQALDSGDPLWLAMEKAGGFPGYVPGLVRTGEETGRLEEALEALSEYYDRNARTIALIRRSLAWPSMVLLLMLVVLGVLLVEVLPVFDSVYASLGSGLTGLSALLLNLGSWLQRSLPVLLGLLMLAVAAVAAVSRSEKAREKALGWYVRRFGDRGIARKFNNARFAQGLAMALGSGLEAEKALLLARQLLPGQPGALERIDGCREKLASGMSLPEAMEAHQLLPPAAVRMLAVGLRGGNGDQVMEDAARRLMEDARQSVEDAAARVEPALVLLTSALVGVVLLSAMLPLMNIMASLG